jgi:hypothetical protein
MSFHRDFIFGCLNTNDTILNNKICAIRESIRGN